MEVIVQQGFESWKGGGMTVPILLLMFAVVIGWFPGHNARRRQHGHAGRVNAASWCLIFVSVVITTVGALDGIVGPILLAVWVAITTWSYGRTNVLPKAKRYHAFEVVTPAVANDESLPSPAVGS